MCDDYCAALIHSSQFLICDPSRPSDIADALETGILIFCRIILVVLVIEVDIKGEGGGFNSSECSMMKHRLAIWSALDLYV